MFSEKEQIVRELKGHRVIKITRHKSLIKENREELG